jgi:capsular exopolysaccharide synthesis family protein
MAASVEANTRRVYFDLKSQADAMNDKTIAYTIMRQEADQSRTLYETLFKQLKEAGVLADFKVSNVSIVDPARVPARPAKPNVLLYLAGAIFGGLAFGCVGAFLRDMLDSKIRSLPDLEAQLGHLPLGVLPFHNYQARKPTRANLTGRTTSRASLPSASRGELVAGENSRLAALSDPRSAYVEALRALRTSILLSRGGAPPQVMLVTSSIASEGKSMLSLNLATLLAQQGKTVLLVDGDFRRPTLHRTMNIATAEGLSSFLAGHTESSDPNCVGIQAQQIPGLTLLPAGPVPPFPAELLGSEQMRNALQAWRTHFDFIIIDGAPVLPVTDSVVLSTMVDFTLLVARYELTERQSLDRSYRLLQGQTDHTRIGVVLNAVNRDSSTYYQYYGYKDSVYYGSTKKYA